MPDSAARPWLPRPEPDLARLAMAAADLAGVAELRDWPEWRKGGVGFRELPVFLPWIGEEGPEVHLVLLQPRELGALVPGSRPQPMPAGWLEELDLEALGRPLALHPDLEGRGAVHVVQVLGPGRARLRSLGGPAHGLVREVLARLTGSIDWEFSDY